MTRLELFARRTPCATLAAELGVEPRAIAPAELSSFGQAEIKRWSEAVNRSGAQID